MFTRAVVRQPSVNLADGLTSAGSGKPEIELALKQHEHYCRALQSCGLDLISLPADDRYPDSTFVEDTAVVTQRGAIITRPGADSRRGEIEEMRGVLPEYFPRVFEIRAPGTLDGGDICQAGDHFFAGLSDRTNEEGAKQFAAFVDELGYSSTLIDIRGLSKILHLKTGIACLGGNRILLVDELKDRKEFSGYDLVHVNADEAYAANCLLINDRVLIAAGHPVLDLELQELGYQTMALDMSEFQKMDGGLSCLSVRF